MDMARHYGFDGWLVNIENESEVEKEGGVENVLCVFESAHGGDEGRRGGREGGRDCVMV